MIHRGGGRCLTAYVWLAGALVAGTLLGGCQQTSTRAPATPSMRMGADSASAPLVESLLNVYEALLTGGLLTLETSSREAILAEVASGELDAAILFHPLDGQELFDTPVSYAPLTIIVPSNIQVGSLTRDDLRSIFAGQIASWSEVGGPDLPIQVISATKGSSERLAFNSLVMGSYPITSAARLVMDGEAAVDLVRTTPGAIGYGVSGVLPGQVITLNVDGVPATLEEVQSRRYSLVSAVVFVSEKEPEDQLRSFLDWILSDAGQEVVRRHMVGLSD